MIFQRTVVSVSVEIEHASNGSRMRRDLLSSDGGDKNQVTTMNVAFDLPDITVTIETATGTAQLEAYRSVNNDKFLHDTSGDKISQLFWVTVGLPNFIRSPSPRNSSDVKLFHFNNRGFSVYLEMKTDAMGRALAAAARNKYKVNISDNQVVNLILSQFECSTILYDDAGDKYVLKGRVTDFRNFPLRMNFVAPIRSHERRLFEQELKASVVDLEFDCDIKSSGGKVIKTNTLTISANQLQQIGLEEKLFGPAGSNGKNDVYVTRDQMSALSSEMYSTLNIVEEYQMPEFQFKEAFVDELIKQISTNAFDQVPIDTVLASLSKYGFDIGADIKPDVIKKDIGSILKIEKTDSSSRIILDNQNDRDFSNSESNNGEFGLNGEFGPCKFGLTAKWGRENQQTSSSKDRSLSDQLRALNEETKNEAHWEIEGDRVIPKSLNVARLTRAKLSKTLTFNRIRMQTFEAPFHRTFSLYTLRTSVSASFLDRLSSRVEELEGTSYYLAEMTKQLEETTKEGKLDSDKEIANIRTNHSAFSANVDSRIGSMGTAIQNAQSRIDSVSSTALRRCRICFQEGEGSSQCERNRDTCSGYGTTDGGWTEWFRDETDNRNGGCQYHWKVECITY